MEELEVVGPYVLVAPIASGGFGQVFLGRHAGPLGFTRWVALKGLSPDRADELEAVAMLIDEARIAARVQHPNVVPMLDVVEQGRRIWLVMEYVHGESLARLLGKAAEREAAVPQRVARAVACGVLRGLHAAHEATDARGRPLGIVHRDVSPHNVIVSAHGVARVVDFGIAKAIGRLAVTRHGQLKGKLAYMAPEQLSADEVDRRVDVYGASVLIAELFAGRRLSEPKDLATALGRAGPSVIDDAISELGELAPVLVRGLAKDPAQRFATAALMADAIEATGPLAPEREVGAWLNELCGELLREREARWQRLAPGADAALVDAPRSALPQAVSDATVSAVDIAPATHEGARSHGESVTLGEVRAAPAAASPRAFTNANGGATASAKAHAAPQPRRLSLLAAAAAVIGVGVAARMLWPDAPASESAASVSPPVAASASVAPVAVGPRAQPTVSSSLVVASAALGSASAPGESALARGSAHPGVGAVRATSLPAAPAAASARACQPPYKLDERGVKVLKLECFR